jgi:hypothetical protein
VLLPSVRRPPNANAVITSTIWTIGGIAGALTITTVLFVAGRVLAPVQPGARAVVAAALGVALLAFALSGRTHRVPHAHRQIPPQVIRARRRVGVFRFAYELGTGVRTFATSIAPHLLGLSLLLYATDWWQAAVVALGFGIGRSVPMWLRTYGLVWRRQSIAFHARWTAPVATFALLATAAR